MGEIITAQQLRAIAKSELTLNRLHTLGNEIVCLLREDPELKIYRIAFNAHGIHNFFDIPTMPASSENLTGAILEHKNAWEKWDAKRDKAGDLISPSAEADAYDMSVSRYVASQCNTFCGSPRKGQICPQAPGHVSADFGL